MDGLSNTLTHTMDSITHPPHLLSSSYLEPDGDNAYPHATNRSVVRQMCYTQQFSSSLKNVLFGTM